MGVSLTAETQRMIEDRMKRDGFDSPDELVRLALEHLDGMHAGYIEDLDAETQAALARAEAQSAAGEGRPWEEVRDELWAKHFGK